MVMKNRLLQQYRYFLKDTIRKNIDFSETDQSLGIEPPPIEKPYSSTALRIDLLKTDSWKNIANINLSKAI